MQFTDLILPHRPLVQAPMAGGITTPDLVAAVADTGAVGSFGFAYSTPDQIAAQLRAAQACTSGCINANFFVFSPVAMPPTSEIAAAVAALNTIAPDIRLQPPEPPFFPDLSDQLAPIWALKPQILTFHFGIPSPQILAHARALGICTGITATTRDEAIAITQAGADFIVAQGIEAGGHRGSFDPNGRGDTTATTADLTRQIIRHSSLPVISAGGIMTAQDLQARLQDGAVAGQCGSAFLLADEAGTSHPYRMALTENRPTEMTTGFSGRRARAVENTFTRAMRGEPVLPFPLQNTVTTPLRNAANAGQNAEWMSLWAGVNHSQAQSRPAAELVADLCGESP